MTDIKTVLIEEFTSVDPVTASEGDTAKKVKELMDQFKIRHIPIVKSAKAIGIISERDLLQCLDRGEKDKLAKDIMIDAPFTVSCNQPLKEVVFQMSEKKIGSALVNDLEGNLMGIFTSIDALNAIIENDG